MSEHNHIILYAEDDPDDYQLVQEAFHSHPDVTIKHVTNGRQVMEFLQSLSSPKDYPCLIILDINMPLMDGREALMKIKQMADFKDIPVIMFTTSSNELDRMFAQKNGAEFVTKPLQFDRVSEIAREFSGRCRNKG